MLEFLIEDSRFCGAFTYLTTTRIPCILDIALSGRRALRVLIVLNLAKDEESFKRKFSVLCFKRVKMFRGHHGSQLTLEFWPC